MRRRPFGCLTLFAAALCLLAGLWLGVLLPDSWRGRLAPGWHGEGPVLPSKHFESPTPAPSLPPEKPLPTQLVIPPRQREVARMYNGLQVRSSVEAEQGRAASVERETAASYAIDLKLQIKVPVPCTTVEELSRSAPSLASLLPKLPALIEKSAVSKFYYGIYQLKTDLLRQNLMRLDALLPRDTFYDTETILELQDPDSKRKALLIQTDMDVDSDGSDPDRSNEIDTSDPNFAPLTSYKWPRRTATPSALIKPYQDRLAKLVADASATSARRVPLPDAIGGIKSEIYQIEHYSSLIAKADPYIVLPGFMVRQTGHPYQPHLGDFAVVVAGDKLYPAIFGDIGPSDQLGEASLRIAQAVDPRATPERSPIDELKITYIVFPGTAETPFGPPDLDKIRARCQGLVNEIGGSKSELYVWTNPFAPKPTPTPAPTPAPSAATPATPAPVASATAPATPSPSPAPSAQPSAGQTEVR